MQEKQHRPVRRPDNTGNPERTTSLSRKILPILLIPCAVWFIHAVETGELAQHVQSFKARIASGGESINSDRAPRRVATKSGLDRKALEELFDRGLECYARDKRGAADWFRKAAEQGHAEAQYRIADMYAEGVGVGFSIKLAQDWFRLAAEQGHAAAQYKMGILCMENEGRQRDMAQALEWFRRAAGQGYAAAQCDLGVMYAEGMGVPQDDARALEWFRKAAEQGSAEAQYNLGVMYAGGEGVPRDMAQALEWFRKAAGQGNAAAQNYLGIMYCNGYGVAEDRHEAARWFRKAASQGQRNALAAMRQAEIAEANEENATSDTQTR